MKLILVSETYRAFLTVTVSLYLTADKEAAYSSRSHFCSDERHRGHLHGDFTMGQHLKKGQKINWVVMGRVKEYSAFA